MFEIVKFLSAAFFLALIVFLLLTKHGPDVPGEIGVKLDVVNLDPQAARDEAMKQDLRISDQNVLLIASVVPASPAEKAGLKIGDRILSIDQKSVTGKTLAEALSLLQGRLNTEVTLGLFRKEGDYSYTWGITVQRSLAFTQDHPR